MANKTDKKILEELKRFQTITQNSQNLDEQMVSGLGNLGMGSHVERLLNRAKAMEMEEQEVPELEDETETEELEIPLDPEGETEELDTDIDAELDTEVDTEVGGEEIEDTTTDETELDVTELVTKQDEVNTELSDQKDILQKNTESLDDLMNKLSSLENHLTSMDDMVNKISNLEKKIEEYRPRTPEEKIGLRKYDSGPFNKTLTDFFTDKEEVFDETGKKQYILKKDDVENYSEDDIKKSFDPNQEEN